MRFQLYLRESSGGLSDWNGYVKRIPMLKSAVDILNKIEKKGYSAYIVGGSVRDIILGIDPKDVDIATDCSIDVLDDLFKTHDIGKNRDFGIVVVDYDGFSFEIAQFREDGKYIDGRKPENVSFDVTLEGDLSRRDFTINAMAIDGSGKIIDVFNGQNDIQNKVLKTVGDPEKRFSEDYLRMLRAARFSARMGFDVDPITSNAIKKNASKIATLSKERIKEELFKSSSLESNKFAKYLKILDNHGILDIILPELQKLKTSNNDGMSLWDQMISRLDAFRVKDPIKNLAIAMTHLSDLDGVESSIRMIMDIAKRLKLSNKERDSLVFVVLNKSKLKDLSKIRPSDILAIINNDSWDVLVDVMKATNGSKDQVSSVLDILLKLKSDWGSGITNLIDGERVMRIARMKPGPDVGKILKEVLDWMIKSNIRDQDKIDNKIIELTK